MSVVKVRKNGMWVDTVGVISDADTLDGRHANDFVLVNEVASFQDKIEKVIEKFIVTITENGEDTYVADKTFAEVHAALVADRDVRFQLKSIAENGRIDMFCAQLLLYSNQGIWFIIESDWFDGSSSMFFSLNADDSITFVNDFHLYLPTVTEADNGKILVVEGGRWVARPASSIAGL